MKNKKQVIEKNYLEKIPKRPEHINWSTDDGIVTLHLENKGFFNKVAQKLFKKPRISHVHLDEMGSFLWKRLDGKKSIEDLGEKFKEAFGEKAEPLYERLAKYMQILHSYGFISFV